MKIVVHLTRKEVEEAIRDYAANKVVDELHWHVVDGDVELVLEGRSVEEAKQCFRAEVTAAERLKTPEERKHGSTD